MAQTVLVTGCSTGFGKLIAKTFAARGWNVVATMRSPEKETELTSLENVLVTALDVTDSKSIEKAFEAGTARFGAISAVVNNAGYGSSALFEQSPDESVRALFETNVFGVMAVMRQALPSMRAAGKGCVVNVTSMAGLMGIPGNSCYSSSKFAVEGLTEALALEYKPLGVRVVSVAPGAFDTGFAENKKDHLTEGGDELAAYSKKLRDHFTNVVGASKAKEPQDPQEVAEMVYELVTKEGDVAVHNAVGADAKRLSGLIDKSESRQTFCESMEKMLLPKL